MAGKSLQDATTEEAEQRRVKRFAFAPPLRTSAHSAVESTADPARWARWSGFQVQSCKLLPSNPIDRNAARVAPPSLRFQDRDYAQETVTFFNASTFSCERSASTVRGKIQARRASE